MKQLMRRLTALFLALALVMSFAAVASAAEEDDSADFSSSLTTQENEAVFDAEDLYTETSDSSAKDQSDAPDASEEASGEDSESTGEAQEDESPAEQPQEEKETEDTTPAAPVPQDVTSAWAKDGESFTLSYNDGTAAVKAQGGLFAVPAQEAQIEDAAYTFAAGVYEFDAEGKLVTGAYSVTETPASVTVLTLTDGALTKKVTDTRSISFTGETAAEGNAVTPGAVLLSGEVEGVLYYEGAVYSGYYRAEANGVLMAVKEGVAAPYSGQMTEQEGLTTFVDAGAEAELDNLWYSEGKLYTGFARSTQGENANLLYACKKGVATLYGGCMKKDVYKTYMEDGEVANEFDGLWYVEGTPFTGWYQNVSTKKFYLLNEGKIVVSPKGVKEFTGLMKELNLDGVTYKRMAQNNKSSDQLTGLYYQRGVPLTGVPSVFPTDGVYPKKLMHMYKNGKIVDMKDGWYRAPRAAKEFYKPFVYYYFKDNVAYANEENVKLKAIQPDSETKALGSKHKDSSSYYYTFTSTGTLVTNMYQYLSKKSPSALKSGKFQIFCDHTNYTGTILMYNSKTKKYDIPLKSFVISMSKSMSSTAETGTRYGNYALASGYRGWYKWVSPRTHQASWFSSSNHIWGSGSMFHGAAHKFDGGKVKGKARVYQMLASSYNKMGHAQTYHCVRAQNINILLISKLYKNSPHKVDHGRSCATRVRVYLTRNNSNKHLPFGQMTLLHNFDFCGYILQSTDAYGNGKNKSFDPTDYRSMGTTIYVSKKKTGSKSACERAVMTGYSGYSVSYGAP